MAKVDLSGARWRTSSRSGNENEYCVEVAVVAEVVGVRDSKDRAGGAVVFTRRAWRSFLDSL